LTTAFQDHVRLRNKFGYKVDDDMWEFFAKDLGVVDFATGAPIEGKFGNPAWVYVKFCQKRGDARPEQAILSEAHERIAKVQQKGVPIAVGYGAHPWNLNVDLDKEIRRLYDDAKWTLWNEYTPEFLAKIPSALHLRTLSADRQDYVFHPETGERLCAQSVEVLEGLKDQDFNVAIVISDGLCADAIMDHGHLFPFLSQLRQSIGEPIKLLENNLVIKSGRVSNGDVSFVEVYMCELTSNNVGPSWVSRWGSVVFHESTRTKAKTS
jgi:ethanolamine ammonia-lyase large subunit